MFVKRICRITNNYLYLQSNLFVSVFDCKGLFHGWAMNDSTAGKYTGVWCSKPLHVGISLNYFHYRHKIHVHSVFLSQLDGTHCIHLSSTGKPSSMADTATHVALKVVSGFENGPRALKSVVNLSNLASLASGETAPMARSLESILH